MGLRGISAAPALAANIDVGVSVITGGTTGRLLYDNAGLLGKALLTYSAGVLQHGAADAAVAVAQTIRTQSVVAGTAAANGADLTIIGSLPTGTGTSGDIIVQTGVKTGSGTTQGTATTALTIKGETQAVNATGPVTALSGTAIPAGGTAGAGLLLSSTASFGVFFGSGAPNIASAKGSIYLRSDGSGVADRMYIQTGSTAGSWTNFVTGA